MTRFTQSLQTFLKGSISSDEFLAEVDRILADDSSNATSLLAMLSEEEVKNSLPANVSSALYHKIEPLAQKWAEFENAEEVESISTSDEIINTHPDTVYQPKANQDANTCDDIPATTIINEDIIDPIKGKGDILNNRFKLQECVGSGGMGTVYKALDRRKIEAHDRNPHVAVKVLNLQFRTHPNSLIALQREAKKCQGLSHPNIVRVYDFDRDGSTVYMTMEYLRGVTLGHKMRAPNFRGFPRDEALMIINKSGQALRFAHECGIVHADFKPANVYITDNGEVKVIDFGISRAYQLDEAVELEATRFDPGTLRALTPSYASPEMLEFQKPDPRDDIFALACTAYEIFTGKHPFGRIPASVANESGLKLRRHEALTYSQFIALRHALQFDRNKRTATVEQFLKEINQSKKIISKSMAALGLIGLAVGVTASYLYLSTEGVSLDILNRDSPSMEKAFNKSDPEVSPVIDEGNEKRTIEQIKAQRGPPAKTSNSKGSAPAQQLITKTFSAAAVTPLISGIACSALNASIKGDKLFLKGFALQRDKQMLEKRLSAIAGAGRADLTGIDIMDQRQCPILEFLSSYWWANQGMNNRISIESNKLDNHYMEGENLVLNISTPNYDSFIYVDYYLLDGGVLHMVPNQRFSGNQAPSGYHATIGDLGEWAISKPFGTELIAIIATPEPLFKSQRKEFELQKKYLSDLENRLTQLVEKNNGSQITVDFILIKTQP